MHDSLQEIAVTTRTTAMGTEADEAKFARMKTQKGNLLPSASQKRTVRKRPPNVHKNLLSVVKPQLSQPQGLSA